MTEGEDPPVLLVHGFASSAEHNWRHPGWLTPADVRCMQAVLGFLGC